MSNLIDLGQLPSATKARFGLLLTICLAMAFVFFQSPFWPNQGNAILNGAVGAIAVMLLGSLYYFLHPTLRRRSFGAAADVPASEPIAVQIGKIAAAANVAVPQILMDRDIRNYDALAFGGPASKTILLGRGNLLLFASKPAIFDARIAHEIGHLRNRDVTATFIAEGLIFILIAAFIINTLYYDLSVFLVVGQDNGASSMGDWISTAMIFTLEQVFIAALWFAILVSEHCAFLRSRELYADNVAALLCGTSSIKSALWTPDTGQNARGLMQRIRKAFSTHPEVQFRRSVVDNPTLVLEPTPVRFCWLGYVVGLLHVIAWNIRGLPDAGQSTMEDLFRLLFTTASGFFLLLFLILLFGAAIVAIGSLVLRTACWIKLADLTGQGKLRKVAGSAIALVGGLLVGMFFNPFTIAYSMQGADFAASGIGVEKLQSGLVVAAQIVVAIIVGIPIIGRLLTSPRVRAPRLIAWIGIAVCLYVTVSYGSLSVFAFFDPNVAELGDTLRTPLMLLSLAAAFFGFGYLIARGKHGLRRVPTKTIAAWAFRQPGSGTISLGIDTRSMIVPT